MPRGTKYGNNYYEVFSSRLNRVVRLFSNIEYYNYLSIEINPNVADFCEQPLQADIEIDGHKESAIFDMWVEYKNGECEFQEVKYKSELTGKDEKSLRSQEQIRRETIWCAEKGYKFTIRTDKDIIAGKYTVSNMNVMAARLRRYIPKDDYYTKRLVENLNGRRGMDFGAIKELKLLPQDKELDHICFLFREGIIKFNIDDRPIDDKLFISLRNHER